MPSLTWRERLPSAIAAIALQAGMLALLAFSFAVVRHVGAEKETFLTLPPLAQTQPAPMVIDARGRPKPITPAPPPPAPDRPAAPAPAAPPIVGAPAAPGNAPQAAPAQALADCIPAGQARPAYRVACPPPPPPRQAQSDDMPLHPQSHVKDEAYYAAEKARRDAPASLPGAAAGPLGILLTALFNPSAFADKSNYSYGPPLPPRDGTPAAAPVSRHVSDEEFKKALQAANDAKRALYAKPAPPPDAPNGAAP